MKKVMPYLLMAALVGACATQKGKEFYQDRINATRSVEVPLLKTITKVGEALVTHEQEGNGNVIGTYLFSKDHVTSRYSIQVPVFTPFGIQVREVPVDRKEVVSEITYLDDIALVPVVEDKKTDIAIFDLKKTPKLCEKYCNDWSLDDLMTESEIYNGMRVFINASPKGRQGFYKESIVTNLRDEQDKDTQAEDTYMLQDPVIPGTSAKFVWHEDEEGNYKVAGVVHYVWNLMAGVGFMDGYIDAIKRYEEATEKDVNDGLTEETNSGIKRSKLARTVFDQLKAKRIALTFWANNHDMY